MERAPHDSSRLGLIGFHKQLAAARGRGAARAEGKGKWKRVGSVSRQSALPYIRSQDRSEPNHSFCMRLMGR